PGAPGTERVHLKSVAAEIVANAVDAASRDVNRYTRYADEALSRSKIAFWFSLVLGAMGFSTILAGAIMAYFASLDASIVSGVAGVVNTSIAALLYQRSDVADKRASAWFEKAGDNLKESDNLERALGVLDLLDDVEMRNRLIAIAGIKQLFPDENAESLSDVMELKR
uniref:TRADD-N-associated membrane domain-containing protein n=1 Tax=Amycolatopsis kentuckyensis TaxID=218823 RepID=UPI001ABFC2DF